MPEATTISALLDRTTGTDMYDDLQLVLSIALLESKIDWIRFGRDGQSRENALKFCEEHGIAFLYALLLAIDAEKLDEFLPLLDPFDARGDVFEVLFGPLVLVVGSTFWRRVPAAIGRRIASFTYRDHATGRIIVLSEKGAARAALRWELRIFTADPLVALATLIRSHPYRDKYRKRFGHLQAASRSPITTGPDGERRSFSRIDDPNPPPALLPL